MCRFQKQRPDREGHVAAPSKSSQRTARPVTIVSRMFGKLRSSPGRSATATWRAKREIKCVSQPTVKDDLCSAASAAMTSRRGDLELARARNSARAGWQRRGQRRGREEAELERRRMARVPGGRPSAPAGSARKRSRRSAARPAPPHRLPHRARRTGARGPGDRARRQGSRGLRLSCQAS